MSAASSKIVVSLYCFGFIDKQKPIYSAHPRNAPMLYKDSVQKSIL
jgi:hypothetical protein